MTGPAGAGVGRDERGPKSLRTNQIATTGC